MFFSIGYSLSSVSRLIDALKSREVTVLIDVRTTPRSRNPQFSKGYLRESLVRNGIAYIHDPRLGGKEGKRGPQYREGLNDLIMKSDEGRNVAFMCLERRPEDCHRGWWITPDLIKQGQKVDHITPLAKDEDIEHTYGDFTNAEA